MQRIYSQRDATGPEFDDRLIKLVRTNPAIYDVNHPNYRRNPVRVAIWDAIALELNAPSKFLQTKWKNIRYNYLQEIKCLETGLSNSNIRKRRFTEDLSFLQHTAQTYNVKKSSGVTLFKTNSYNSSDNDSNSYMYPDTDNVPSAYEVIEIDHSDDDGSQLNGDEGGDYHAESSPNGKHYIGEEEEGEELDNDALLLTELKAFDEPATTMKTSSPPSPCVAEPTPDVTIEQTYTRRRKSPTAVVKEDEEEIREIEPRTTQRYASNPSSPLLTPMALLGNTAAGAGGGGGNAGGGHQQQQPMVSISETNGEITIEPIPRQNRSERAAEIMSNASKRKSMPAPFPVLTPINDPIELYCLSLVDSLRNMPRSERERVKFEFASILKDAKYKDQS